MKFRHAVAGLNRHARTLEMKDSMEAAANDINTMKLTIDHDSHGNIVARDEQGKTVATRKRTNNPAALSQIIYDAEEIGEIDWDNSQVAKPE